MYWIIHKTNNIKFPFRVEILDGERQVLCVLAQDAWPGAKGNVFCMRDIAVEHEVLGELERVPVLTFDTFGRSIRIVLDRPMKKRCEFLFLTKRYKHKDGEYEQIFFKTQTAQKNHKSKSKLALRPTGQIISVVIDTAERYAWKFPSYETNKKKLPAGDYALMHENSIAAVVERKSFDNMLAELYRMSLFHQSLRELTAFPNAALVIEGQYNDFLSPKHLKNRCKPGFCFRALAEIHVMHPKLQIIYAGTRKDANLWTWGFFKAVHRRMVQEQSTEYNPVVAERTPAYVTDQLSTKLFAELGRCPEGKTLIELENTYPEADAGILKRILAKLVKQHMLVTEGRGKNRVWLLADRQNDCSN